MTSEIASMNSSMTKFDAAFPSKRLEGDSGEDISASRQSFGSSRTNERLKTRAPANAKTSQRSPPPISRVTSEAGSKAKLKRRRITIANAPAPFSDSLVRNSMARSLRAINSAWRSDLILVVRSLLGGAQIHVQAVQKARVIKHFFGALARISQSAVLD